MASITPPPLSQLQPLLNKPQQQLAILNKPLSHRFLSLLPKKTTRMAAVVSATMAVEKAKTTRGGFVEEMRYVAMKLHDRDQAKEGEKEPQSQPVAKWEPNIEGYLKFLVDSKLVYDTLERIVDNAAFPDCHVIPEPSSPGVSYAQYLEELSEKDPQVFLCHFYNTYFAHTAGGMIIGRKVAEKIPNGKELEFYKWDGDLSQLLQNVREKLNRVCLKLD
ncbi:hypothetical protein BUALT_Bualt05G0006300 [Buddleja alternifolia]|uniref:heme oxygenase (biliverdin-producing) n=1 Tax=Buddleja alternifolia TaxID=168488 RepID=A0AAV6XMC1_9LAMI|nr:hypothetical protein BUALT_Bualt05G0006300 [Buddleja alternifolia]